MTTERLEQYQDLKREIKQLEEQYQELMNRKSCMTSDSVSGSMSEYPYIRHVVKIEGLGIVDQERADRMRRLTLERRQVAENEVEEIDKWIASVKDSRMRQIISYKIVRGMSWIQIAHRIGGNVTADGVRMAFTRFMKKR